MTADSTEHWTVGGVDLLSLAYSVTAINGADDFPPLRGADMAWAGLPGRRSMSVLADERQIDLGIRIKTTNSSGITTGGIRQQARANLEALYLVLAPGLAQQSLVRTMPDGTTRTAQAKCVMAKTTEFWGSGNLNTIATFVLADPYFYGADVVDSARVITGSGMAWSMTHPGTVRGRKATIAIHGAITNPQVTNTTTGALFLFTGTVGSSQTLTVATSAFTATKAAAPVIASITHSGDKAFINYDPGVNSFTITGSAISGSPTITTTLSPPYL